MWMFGGSSCETRLALGKQAELNTALAVEKRRDKSLSNKGKGRKLANLSDRPYIQIRRVTLSRKGQVVGPISIFLTHQFRRSVVSFPGRRRSCPSSAYRWKVVKAQLELPPEGHELPPASALALSSSVWPVLLVLCFLFFLSGQPTSFLFSILGISVPSG
jgi:hypothetical protein